MLFALNPKEVLVDTVEVKVMERERMKRAKAKARTEEGQGGGSPHCVGGHGQQVGVGNYIGKDCDC